MNDLLFVYVMGLVMGLVFFAPALIYSMWQDISYVSRYTWTRREPTQEETAQFLVMSGQVIGLIIIWPITMIGIFGYGIFKLGSWIHDVVKLARS